MEVDFLVENIERFLPLLNKTLPSHSQVPVLSNLLLEANEDGFFIFATDLELGVKIKIPAKIIKNGAITVPGKQFIEVLNSLPKDKVSLIVEKETLFVKSRDNSVTFQTISREEFPSIIDQKGDKVGEFSEEEMKSTFQKIIFAASLDESRPELTGILLSQKQEGVDFVATDGFRLSIKTIYGKKILQTGERIIISSRLINEAMLLGGSLVKMYVYGKGNQVVFEDADATIVGRLINGEFPSYEKVIPRDTKVSAIIDAQDFLQKLKLASVFARESANIVKIKIKSGKIELLSKSSGLGEGNIFLDAQTKGGEGEISFNAKFLNDLLRNLGAKSIEVSINSAVEPASFKTEEDEGFVHIIMPIKIQD
ncbi:MAG: DNA polymerase III subunit beta [Candidatus Levybacteria bacterium CG10_big_fil_rev_8_21_14_0_10_36_7]|nr:MAG: DNA polymerase III subunit beta [Candidatus Levybacteria bacterium CG10_big_fil_rev_8_21_14_0_10_36_7]